MGILLNDQELDGVYLEVSMSLPLDSDLGADLSRLHDRAVAQAQLKKVVDAFRQQEGEKIDAETIYRIGERTLRRWEKEAGIEKV